MRNIRETSSRSDRSTVGIGSTEARSVQPDAFTRRIKVSHEGLVSPSSIRATTDCAVFALDARSRWESRALALASFRIAAALVTLDDSQLAISLQLKNRKVP
jgi:hypothetical protein